MINAEEILVKMNEAIVTFGTYSFMDKGPSEVMDLDSLVDELLEWHSVEGMAEILKKVSEHNEYGKKLAEALVSSMDHMIEEEFDKLLELSGVEY